MIIMIIMIIIKIISIYFINNIKESLNLFWKNQTFFELLRTKNESKYFREPSLLPLPLIVVMPIEHFITKIKLDDVDIWQ